MSFKTCQSEDDGLRVRISSLGTMAFQFRYRRDKALGTTNLHEFPVSTGVTDAGTVLPVFAVRLNYTAQVITNEQ